MGDRCPWWLLAHLLAVGLEMLSVPGREVATQGQSVTSVDITMPKEMAQV